jgi:two-component system, NarL family, sensor kinase
MAKTGRLHEYVRIMPASRPPGINTSPKNTSLYTGRAPADKEQDNQGPEFAVRNEELAAAFEKAEASERERRKVEQQLRAANEKLDLRIRERTQELTRANELLQGEIQRRVQTEEMLRKLSARILTLQDEERRRLGRELHDSAGQMLAALHINLGVIAQRAKSDLVLAAKVADSAALADQVISEIRTLSYLLHPPMLDEAGLASAVEWYVRGFSERSNIAVSVKIDSALPRFPTEVETAIFRIVQESLVNIHRHSRSRTATIDLRASPSGAFLAIRDEGCGITPEILESIEDGGANIGVGIGGMRERARQLGGSIAIQSANPGTLVQVKFPVLRSAASGTAAGRETNS